jgi:hypothetical protein
MVVALLTMKSGAISLGFRFTEQTLSGAKPHGIIFRQELQDGIVDFLISNRDAIRVHAICYWLDDNLRRLKFEVFSCPLVLSGLPTMGITMDWVDWYAKLYINGRLVGSTYPLERWVASELRLIELPRRALPHKDFSLVNARKSEARAKAFERHLSRTGRPGFKRGDLAHSFNQLAAEERQISDLLQLVKQGNIHHILGLAARLRLTIVEGTPLPLLQLCAGAYGLPLIVHTSAYPDAKLPGKPAMYTAMNISGPPNHSFSNPVDLDRWLGFVGAINNGKEYSHSKVLVDIGNTVGAHADPDITASVSLLRTMTTTQTALEAPMDGLGKYVERVAESVLPLFQQVREAHEEALRNEAKAEPGKD